MNPTSAPTRWHNQNAWLLESDTLRTIVVPEMGAKIVSLFDKRHQLEWLPGPGQRPFQPVPYGATFTDQDMSGWDEMFPTINACVYPGEGDRHGVALPDHGEVWTLPWSLDTTRAGQVTLSVDGHALPYHLTRTLTYSAADTLQLDYELVNRGAHTMPYLWAAHPQFLCDGAAQLILPQHITAVSNAIAELWGWGAVEARFKWPVTGLPNGTTAQLDQIGSPALKRARKFFVPPGTPVNWAGLIRLASGAWLRMQWDDQRVPYLGVWVDEGVFNPEAVAALEPMTGYFDNLVTAWDKRLVALLEPGATHRWALTVRVGAGEQPFPDQQ